MPVTKPGRECDRPCAGTRPYNCFFEFWTLSARLEPGRQCPEGRNSDPAGPCYGDGGSRNVTLISDRSDAGRIPGPAIAVCRGDRVTVRLHNNLEEEEGEGTTIHWHGVSHRAYGREDSCGGTGPGYDRGATPWADGVPYVTQCPVGRRRILALF